MKVSELWERILLIEKHVRELAFVSEIEARLSRIEEEFKDVDISTANATARSGGAVGGKAVTPKYVSKTSSRGESILDYGAGPKAIHSKALRRKGFRNVTSYDFGDNFIDGVHDKSALDKKYSTVFASNVLNVQSSREMMAETIEELRKAVSPSGRLVANYPANPRKSDIEADEVKVMLEKKFKTVEIVDGTNSAPVFECRP